MTSDLRFYFDPVCPFAWMTSKWVRQVMRQRDYRTEWRFISLRQVNADVDYDAHFPRGYEDGHTAGLRLLRVCRQVRTSEGNAAVGALYDALGTKIFELAPLSQSADGGDERGTVAFAEDALRAAGLSTTYAAAIDDDSLDPLIQVETDEALAAAGKDVGTPIIHVDPPHGVAFFGPVISRLPEETDAAQLWDHVVGLARYPGFAELKRSLRERPQLPALGVSASEIGPTEDWHGGSRRTKDQRG
ncbi:hypothetical protein [Cumulibacter soli]|uniref:mycothiol-dependent nitroreductase Rv2466c family protein n=1 Tax=Cumulibacter soli TaxID=2546344 RepID=UPI0010679EA0|nr:hypothetical protein [Cumulibacter soli]